MPFTLFTAGSMLDCTESPATNNVCECVRCVRESVCACVDVCVTVCVTAQSHLHDYACMQLH